jgi:hypothetical protein
MTAEDFGHVQRLCLAIRADKDLGAKMNGKDPATVRPGYELSNLLEGMRADNSTAPRGAAMYVDKLIAILTTLSASNVLVNEAIGPSHWLRYLDLRLDPLGKLPLLRGTRIGRPKLMTFLGDVEALSRIFMVTENIRHVLKPSVWSRTVSADAFTFRQAIDMPPHPFDRTTQLGKVILFARACQSSHRMRKTGPTEVPGYQIPQGISRLLEPQSTLRSAMDGDMEYIDLTSY